MTTAPGGRFTATGVPLRLIVIFAYGLRDFQLTGAPDWFGLDRWNIEAKSEEGTVSPLGPPDSNLPGSFADPFALRVQSLLEDRFQLKWHREVQELPVFEITVAKDGLKMKLSQSQAPPPPPERGARSSRTARGDVKMSGVTVSSLVQELTRQLGRTVIDKTDLKGRYDVQLQWTPETPQIAAPPAAGNEPLRGPDLSGPSIFTALHEQLGLRLEAAKGPVEVFVIDSVQKPTEN